MVGIHECKMYSRDYDICYHCLSYRKCVVMNIDHFGIIITFIVLFVFLTITFLATNGIDIFDFSTPDRTEAFADYCRQLNIKC